MNKKILYAASTFSHLENFHIPYLKYLKEKGYEVHIAGSGTISTPYADKIISIPFEKSIFSLGNLKQAVRISTIIKRENYDIVSMHTTLAAFFIRLGIMLSLKKPPLVINTVHGYLFDMRTPLLKRTALLWAEKFTKRVTDLILVMNQEDFQIAEKHHLSKNNHVFFIDGMGVDLSRFAPAHESQKQMLRQQFGFSQNDFILIYAAEFSKRKNQSFVIEAARQLKEECPNVKLLLVGNGALLEQAKKSAIQYGVEDCVIFPGFVSDPALYYQLSDVCVSSSRSEGLPFNIMEGMSTGLPVVASKVKGHTDLITENQTGTLFEYDNQKEFIKKIKTLYQNRELCVSWGKAASKAVLKYSLDTVFPKVINILKTNIK